MPHPQRGEPYMYAAGVPRVDGRYDLSELDRQREEVFSDNGEKPIRWLPRFGRAVLVSLALAAAGAVIVLIVGAEMLLGKTGEVVPAEHAGLMGLIFLVVLSWMFPFMDYSMVFSTAAQKWLPVAAFIFATSAVNAGLLTVSTLVWPYVVDFVPSGLFIDSWEPDAAHLLVVFLCCWSVTLSVFGGAAFMVRMMAVNPIIAFILGGGWVLGSLGLAVGIVMFIKAVPAYDTTSVIVPAGITLAVVIFLFVCLMPVTSLRRSSPEPAGPVGGPVQEDIAGEPPA
ncbi:hypothetical protein [Brevibacterium gallinarum]|uniref:Uncharacterized protein n=1 Tax=Brevibacterium gallinarum TaxID=2762220 RepID=A0ABR8WWF4_9MICO|nr:hypothetical protein [Brevibacterium gallinarum]MBD8021330.1 hypothetical protein [Brevibacterium gallinarum]